VALPQPDPRLLAAARRGDERAFAWIVQTYQEALRSYVYRLVGNRALAEDLTQEVFLRVYQRLSGFRGQCQFTTWLFQITKNRVLDELKASDRRPVSPVAEVELHGNGVEPADNGETIDAIWEAVSRLDLRLKMALLLRDVVGLSYLEIAEALEVDIGTVKWRIFKARESVAATLTARDLAPQASRRTPAAAAAAAPAA
jgi:RNA polymerase sigma-70 factor (ECF subfamily)